MRIPFETLQPKLKGKDRISAEEHLKSTMKNAPRSIGILTAFVSKQIAICKTDKDYLSIYTEMESKFEELKGDHRAPSMFSLLLFLTKKVMLLLSNQSILYN